MTYRRTISCKFRHFRRFEQPSDEQHLVEIMGIFCFRHFRPFFVSTRPTFGGMNATSMHWAHSFADFNDNIILSDGSD